MADPVRFGIFLAPFHALDQHPATLFQRDLALIEMADDLGFEEAWIGEHHSGGFETIGAPEVFIAAAAERTKRIRLGAGVKSLPYHHPFILADTMVQLDNMTMGRSMFGVGPGALPMDAAQMGIDPRNTRRMMDEALDAVMRLLAGERVTAETDWFKLKDAKLQIEPYTRPRMEMAVTSIFSPAGAMAAGRYGLGLLSLGGATEQALAAYKRNWGVCEEIAAQHGQKVDRKDFRIAITMHIAETREQAIADVAHGFNDWVGYSREVLPFGPIPPEVEDPLSFVIETDRAVIGTPDDAVRMIEAAQKGSGGFGVVLLMAHDWADPQAARRSYELIARYVAPRFQGRLDARRASYDHSHRERASLLPAAQGGVADAVGRYEAASAKKKKMPKDRAAANAKDAKKTAKKKAAPKRKRA